MTLILTWKCQMTERSPVHKNPENIDSGGALTGDVEFRSGDSSVQRYF